MPGGIRQRGGQCFGLGVRIAAVDQDVGSGFGKRPDQFGSDPDGSAGDQHSFSRNLHKIPPRALKNRNLHIILLQNPEINFTGNGCDEKVLQ